MAGRSRGFPSRRCRAVTLLTTWLTFYSNNLMVSYRQIQRASLSEVSQQNLRQQIRRSLTGVILDEARPLRQQQLSGNCWRREQTMLGDGRRVRERVGVQPHNGCASVPCLNADMIKLPIYHYADTQKAPSSRPVDGHGPAGRRHSPHPKRRGAK